MRSSISFVGEHQGAVVPLQPPANCMGAQTRFDPDRPSDAMLCEPAWQTGPTADDLIPVAPEVAAKELEEAALQTHTAARLSVLHATIGRWVEYRRSPHAFAPKYQVALGVLVTARQAEEAAQARLEEAMVHRLQVESSGDAS